MTFDDVAAALHGSTTFEGGKGVSEAVITRAETELDLRIEGSYRAFLRTVGWGGAEGLEVYGLGADVPSYLDLVRLTLSERLEANPRLPPYLLPLANDGGGNHYCLDLRSSASAEAPVIFWDHTAGDSQDEVELVADSFADWILEELNERRQESGT